MHSSWVLIIHKCVMVVSNSYKVCSQRGGIINLYSPHMLSLFLCVAFLDLKLHESCAAFLDLKLHESGAR